MPIKLSTRHEPTTAAHITIMETVVDAVRKHELTYAELMSILVQVMASWTKSEIKSEREPT